MRRADVLGLMASQMMGGRRCDKGEEVAFFKSYIHAADALLREAERVSPEPRDGMAAALQAVNDEHAANLRRLAE